MTEQPSNFIQQLEQLSENTAHMGTHVRNMLSTVSKIHDNFQKCTMFYFEHANPTTKVTSNQIPTIHTPEIPPINDLANIMVDLLKKNYENKHNKKLVLKNELETDRLFWLFYIYDHGYTNYSIMNIDIIVEKQKKMDYVLQISAKSNTKNQAFEKNMTADNKISLTTLFVLCTHLGKQLIYVHNDVAYYEIVPDHEPTTDHGEYNILYNRNNTLHFDTTDKLNFYEIKNTKYRIENINKPFKAITAYKKEDLCIICSKLGIATTNKQTKQNLYEAIMALNLSNIM